ncbi:hypothetical protein [Achromobacter ruhlandii]|uniref:hypothetical protein n=1 Tax=Achromobacter ruhlandii TaxID=72557 RepID=UPI001EEE49CE|nr:hypothetical protein [Achromobacter ruhlandii]
MQFRQNRQGIGVALEALGQRQVDGRHRGERAPSRQGLAMAGQGQAVATGAHQGAQHARRFNVWSDVGQEGSQAVERERGQGGGRDVGHGWQAA